MSALFCAVLLCLLSVSRAPADTDRVFVDVTWNGEAQPRLLVILRDADVLYPCEALAAHAVPNVRQHCTTVDGVRVASLTELRSMLTYTFDVQTLTLAIATSTALLPRRAVAVFPTPQPASDDFIPSALLNYNLHESPGEAIAGSLAERASLAPNLAFDSVFGRTVQARTARGNSEITYDRPERMQRLVAGDTIVTGDGLGAAMTIGGLSVSRAFSLDPYQPTYPMPSMQTTIQEPAVAEVYVDGALVRTLQLSPGQYELSEIPIQSGYSNAKVVLRNAFGAISRDVLWYGAPALLRKGLTDYQYGFGLLRSPLLSGWGAYAEPVASARYALGVSQYSTVSAMFQAAQGRVNAGGGYAAALHFGYLQTDFAFSRGGGRGGTAMLLSYGASGERNAASFDLQVRTPSYSTVDSVSASQALLMHAGVSVEQRLTNFASLSLTAEYNRYRDLGGVCEQMVTLTRRFADWSVLASYARNSSASARDTWSVTMTRMLNRTTSETLRAQSDGGVRPSIAIAHSADSLLGTSYQAALGGRGDGFSGSARIGTPYAVADLRVDGASASMSGDLSGSIVRTQGQTLLAQPVDDAFALIRANGISGVPVVANAHYAGRTNGRGYAIVPSLTSNQGNDVGISSAGLPLSDVIDASDRRVDPRYHAATLLEFAARRLHAVYGELRIVSANTVRVPAYGEFDVTLADGRVLSSPIDETGRFYLDGLAAGTYRAKVMDEKGACTMRFTVPAFDKAAKDVGRILCAA